MCQLCMYVCIRTCSSVWVSEWLCVCVCVCVRRDLIVLMCRDELIMHAVCHSWMDTHTNTQTHIHTYTHTHTHTHTCTHTCTHTHTHTHTHTRRTHTLIMHAEDYVSASVRECMNVSVSVECVSECEGKLKCVSECEGKWVWQTGGLCQWVWGERNVSVSVCMGGLAKENENLMRQSVCERRGKKSHPLWVRTAVEFHVTARERFFLREYWSIARFEIFLRVLEIAPPFPLNMHCSTDSRVCKSENFFRERVLKYCVCFL